MGVGVGVELAVSVSLASLPVSSLNPDLSPSIFVSVSEIVDHIERLQVLREIVKKFPAVNYQVDRKSVV